MRDLHLNKHKIIAGILGIMMLSVVLFSTLYIASETDHECDGEHCPVCMILMQCENTLRSLGDGPAIVATALLPVLCILKAAESYMTFAAPDTLVLNKVRLNN